MSKLIHGDMAEKAKCDAVSEWVCDIYLITEKLSLYKYEKSLQKRFNLHVNCGMYI